MRQITDEKEIKELLAANRTFEMFNHGNVTEGEITTLDDIDIDNILYDMFLGFAHATMSVDDNDKIIISYPHNLCRLESRKKLTQSI